MRKAVALALFLPMLGCSPIESAVLGGATGLWQKHEMLNLEKRVEYLERALKKNGTVLIAWCSNLWFASLRLWQQRNFDHWDMTSGW